MVEPFKFDVNDLIQFVGLVVVVGSFFWALKSKMEVMMEMIASMKEDIRAQQSNIQQMATKDYTDKEVSHLRFRIEKLEGSIDRRGGRPGR